MLVHVNERITDPDVLAVLSPAVGPSPTTDEVKAIAALYQRDAAWHAYVTGQPDPIGFIGVECTGRGEIRLRHIAVSREQRRRGIGSEMLRQVAETYAAHTITAETWRGATGFYWKLGFTVKALGANSEGHERFWCYRETA